MSNVVELRPVPHAAGQAFCVACNHEWTAVAPVGVEDDLECPVCHRCTGRYKFPFGPSEEKVWTCKCGCQLFYMTERGHLCPGCGDYRSF